MRLCDTCLASSGKSCVDAMNYRNFGSSSAWPLTEVTHETYLAMEAIHSPWVAVAGFRLETVAWDILHNVYLGTGRDLVASCIKAFIREGCYDFVGTNELDVVLSAVHREMHATCAQHGLPGRVSGNVLLFGFAFPWFSNFGWL